MGDKTEERRNWNRTQTPREIVKEEESDSRWKCKRNYIEKREGDKRKRINIL